MIAKTLAWHGLCKHLCGNLAGGGNVLILQLYIVRPPDPLQNTQRLHGKSTQQPKMHGSHSSA